MATKNLTINNCEFNIHYMDAKYPAAIAVSYHPKGPELPEESEAIFHVNQHRLAREIEAIVKEHSDYYSKYKIPHDFNQDELLQMEPSTEGNITNSVTKVVALALNNEG